MNPQNKHILTASEQIWLKEMEQSKVPLDLTGHDKKTADSLVTKGLAIYKKDSGINGRGFIITQEGHQALRYAVVGSKIPS